MTKKVIILVVAAIMSVASIFAQGGTTGPLTWQLTGTAPNLTLTISGDGEMPGYGSAVNNAPWYEYRESIATVIIEDGVTTIGDNAFLYCAALNSVIIPNSVTTIGGWAFASCAALTSVTIPESVTTIGSAAFVSCTSLTSVTIPNSVTTIDYHTFGECTALRSIAFPNSVTTIGQQAFVSCTALTSVTIPNSVTTIGYLAFGYCTALNLVTNLNPEPIDISSFGVFFVVAISTCTLKVPTSAVFVYQNSEVWQDFNIIGGGILVNPVSGNPEQGYTIGEGLYQPGKKETATVTAVPYRNFKFVNWTRGGVEVSSDNPYSFTVTEDIELVANFEEEVGINNFELTTIKIYPNPTTGQLKIVSEEMRIDNVDIFDVFGKKVFSQKFLMLSEIGMDILHFPAGVYFVRIQTETGEVTKKVLKE